METEIPAFAGMTLWASGRLPVPFTSRANEAPPRKRVDKERLDA